MSSISQLKALDAQLIFYESKRKKVFFDPSERWKGYFHSLPLNILDVLLVMLHDTREPISIMCNMVQRHSLMDKQNATKYSSEYNHLYFMWLLSYIDTPKMLNTIHSKNKIMFQLHNSFLLCSGEAAYIGWEMRTFSWLSRSIEAISSSVKVALESCHKDKTMKTNNDRTKQ